MNLILDTNTYLHYRLFDQADWRGLLETDRVTLVVPITVIHELDDKKFAASNKRIMQRAARVLKKLTQIHEGQLVPQNKISLNILTEEPQVDWEKCGLSRSSNDDRLIAEVLMFRERATDEVCLVAADYGIRLKATAKSIRSMEPPDEWRIDDKDDRDKEIERLEKEVSLIRQRIPKLALQLIDADPSTGVKHVEFDLSNITYLSEDDIRRQVKEKRERLEELVPKPSSLVTTVTFGMPTQEAIDRYRSDIKLYLDKYRGYLLRLNEYHCSNRLMARIGFFLVNSGTAPAEDIDVILHFPDGFEVHSIEQLPKPPEEPAEPEPPRSLWETLTSMKLTPSILTPKIPDVLQLASLRDSGPKIRKTNSYEVTYCVRRLKHGFGRELDAVAIRFGSEEDVKPFHIDYVIWAANVPHKVEGQLHVVANVKGA